MSRNDSGDFAFHFGNVVGGLSNPKVVKYLKDRGVVQDKLEQLKEMMFDIAKAFYVDVPHAVELIRRSDGYSTFCKYCDEGFMDEDDLALHESRAHSDKLEDYYLDNGKYRLKDQPDVKAWRN